MPETYNSPNNYNQGPYGADRGYNGMPEGSIPLRHSNGSKSFALTFIFADYCSQGVGPMRLLPFLTLAAPSSATAYYHLPTSARKGQLRQVLRPCGSLRLLLLLLWTGRDRLLLRLEYIEADAHVIFASVIPVMSASDTSTAVSSMTMLLELVLSKAEVQRLGTLTGASTLSK